MFLIRDLLSFLNLNFYFVCFYSAALELIAGKRCSFLKNCGLEVYFALHKHVLCIFLLIRRFFRKFKVIV